MSFFQGLGPFWLPRLILSKYDDTYGKLSHLPVSGRPPHYSACAKVSAQVNTATGPYFSRRSKRVEQTMRVKTGASFGNTYTKIGTIQRRLAWPLHKADMQIQE